MMKEYKTFKNYLSIAGLLVLAGFLIGPVSVNAQPGSVTVVYDLGEIESDGEFTVLGDFSECPGVLSVDIPAGAGITGVDVSYSITAQGGAWMSEQRSWLYSPTLGVGEPQLYSGSGTSAGTFDYERMDLTFANFGTGTIEFELHVGRTWPTTTTDCNTTFQFVVNGTWELTVYYDDLPTCSPPTLLSVEGIGEDFVDLSWDESVVGAETGYDWELRTSGDPGSGTDGLVQSGSLPEGTFSATLDDLDALTTYVFYIRSDCDGEESDWSSIGFTTVPGNNDCANASQLIPSISCDGNFVSGSTEAATNSGEAAPTCSATGLVGGDVWYSFEATSATIAVTYDNVVTNGIFGSMVTALYSGDCGDLTQIRCQLSNIGAVFSDLEIGTTYYLRVWTSSTNAGQFNTFDICLREIPVPGNDDCDDAIELIPSMDLVCSNTISASTNGTNSMAVDPGCNATGLAGGDVWFQFTATNTDHVIRYFNVVNNGTFGSMVTEVYSNNCGDLESVDCGTGNNRFLSNLTPGDTYYIRVWTSSTVETQFNIFDVCIGTVPTIEDGDDCDDAIVLLPSGAGCENIFTASTIGATNSMAADPSCTPAGLAGGDIWFAIEATSESMAVIYSNIQNNGIFGTMVSELYEGSCSDLVSIGCVQTNNPIILSGLIVGDTYYLRVWTSSTNANQGNIFDICIVEMNEDDSDCDNPFVVDTDNLPYSFLDGNTLFYGNNFASADRPSIDNVQFGDGTGGGVYLNGFDVVFELSPDRDMLVNIQLTDVDTWVGLWLFEDCPFTQTVAYQTISASGERLLPEIQLSEGVDYYIVVSTFPAPAFTTFNLFVEELLCELECPENVVVSTDAGECGADLAIDFPMLGQYCPVLDFDDFMENSFNDEPNASGFYPVGTTEVTYTYSDTLSGEFSCSFSITVNDEEAPEITCPANVTVEVDFGVTEAFVGDLVASADDNCGVESLMNSFNDGGADASDIYPVGTTEVVFTGTDESGNTAECTTLVTVSSDDVPPINIVCQDVTADLDADGNATVDAEDLDGGSTGGAGSLTFTVNGGSSASFDCDDTGSNSVTLTATDELGNSESCDATVTVEDNMPPVVNCTAEVSQEVETPGDTEVFVNVPLASANDNCGVASLDNSYNDGGADASDVYPVGTTAVTYTAVDVNGNVGECVTLVQVQADLSIVAICDDAAVDLDASGSASLDAVDLDGGSFGGDGALSFSVGGASSADFDCDDVGSNSVILTVSDAAGNSATCESTVSVSDNIDPEVVCVSAIEVAVANPGDTEVFVEVPQATATDNCDVASLENSYNNGGGDASDVYPVGTTSVTYTAVDVNGNSAVCITTIIVEADLTIVAVCQDLGVSLDSDGSATVDAADLDGGSFGGDGDLTFSVDGSSSVDFGCSDVGDNTVILTVSDAAGNSETCESVVTVSDNMAPVVSCASLVNKLVDDVGDLDVFVDVPEATATDNCGVASIVNSYNDGGADASDVYPVGTTQVIFTATDVNGNTATCQTTVIVVADNSIVPVCANVTAQLDENGEATVAAEDLDGGSFGGEGDLSFSIDGNSDVSFDCADVGANTVVLTVTDDEGNSETCESVVTVVDAIVPVVSCPSGAEVFVAAPGDGSVFVGLDAATASDNCGIGSIDNNYNDGGADASDSYPVGTTTVVFTATDVNGNTSTCAIAVTVNGVNPIEPVCNDVTVSLDGNGEGSVSVEEVEGGTTGGEGDLAFTLNGGSSVSFDCDDLGANTVTLTATDELGFSASCDATITVLDEMAPTVDCASDIEVMVTAPGDQEVFVSIPLATASDNCGSVGIVNDATGGGADASAVYQVGEHVITYTATDGSGNSSECQTNLTVLADESLVAVCTDGAATIDASGTATIDAADLDGGSFGGQGELTFAIGGSSTVDFDCDDLGSNTVTLVVSDAAGNSESCEANVVVDLAGVTEVICNQDLLVELDANGNGSVTVSDLIASAEATCGIESMSASQLSFGCGDVGANSVVVTISNILGEEASCTATVTVADNNDPVAECLDLSLFVTDADMTFFVNPLSINGGSIATCGDLTFSLENDPGYTCDDEGVYSVTLVVTSESGNSSTCEAEVTVTCVEGLIQIAGNVEREFGEPLGGVQMTWLGIPGGISLSQGTGLYQIFVEENSNAVVTPQKEGNPGQFITTADLIALQRHILAIEPFESPYRIIAGDASGDDVVSTFDLVILQSLIVGLISDFPAPVWRFVPESYVFDDPLNPFAEDFPEVKGYQGVVNPLLNENWIAIKTGDVVWNSGSRLDAGALEFNVSSASNDAGQQFLVFEAATSMNIFGYQMALDIADFVSVAEFIPGEAMQGMNELNFHMENGFARTNYYNGEGIQLERGTELFRLRINSSAEIANALSVVDIYNQDRMRAEGYPVNGEMVQIALGNVVEISDSWTISNISPVPASDYLQLELNVSVETDFELEVFNSNGQLINRTEYRAYSGINTIPFDLNDFASGAYFIRIVSADKAESLPFIKVD